MIAEIDSSLRKFLSILYRILLVIYCISILIRFDNIYEIDKYLGCFILYTLFYIICIGKEEKGRIRIFSILRLLNDYALFYIVLLGKPISDPHAMILVLLPIINTLNHSGEKLSGFRTIPLYILTILLIFLLDNYQIPIGMIVSILALGTINLFIRIRMSILNYVDKLNEVFEDFEMSMEKLRQKHKLLKSFKEKFSQIPFFLRSFLFTPDSIICFKIINGKLAIKSSSDFILDYKILDEAKLINKLQSLNNVFNYQLEIEKNSKPFNVFITIPLDNSFYVFAITTRRNVESIQNQYFITKFLLPPLMKMAKIIDYDNKLKSARKSVLEKYKEKYNMYEDTRDTIHLIKNKLNPVHAYFDILKRKEKTDLDYTPILEKSVPRIISNLKIIREKSTPYLDRSSHLEESDLKETLNVKYIYRIILDAFQEEMDSDFDIEVKSALGLDRVVEINLEMLYFLLSEIVMNIEEHAIKDSIEITFSFNATDLEITFKNGTSHIKNRDLMMKLFNRDNTSLGLEKNFNGLTILKKYLIALGFDSLLKIEQNSFLLHIKIGTYETADI